VRDVKLTGVGIWNAALSFLDPGEVADAVTELEELGYTSLWFPARGRESFARVEDLLAATSHMIVATGILNLWTVTPEETAEIHAHLQEQYGTRFLLGIGVSHPGLVESVTENARYEKPLGAMTTFLDGLDAAGVPVAHERRVLAALGPRMLELAARRSGGAHPYNVTPEHTATAREALGPTKLLVPEQAVAFTDDVEEARRSGRAFLEHYLERPNYANNLRRLGFTEDDLSGGGSDRLLDALVAHGDEAAIAARVRDHRDAGADSVCIQVVSGGDMGGMVDLHRDAWRALAPALTSVEQGG
jgi:probable F420-dependent oxidoreductase